MNLQTTTKNNTTQAQQIKGDLNGCIYQAEKNGDNLTRLLVQYDQTIIALIENNRFEIKPYPNWKHTVNLIIERVK